MSNVITALFNQASDATAAIYALESKGVLPGDISLVSSESLSKDNFAVTDNSKMPEGVMIGAAAGGLLTAVVAGLTTVGTIATGGAGLLVSGPLVAALAGAGAGATAGGVIGGIIGSNIPEHEIKFYEDALEKGAVLLGIKYGKSNKEDIEAVLEDCEAVKIATA